MVDKGLTIFALMIGGGVAIRIFTNKQAGSTIGTIFQGLASETTAALGGA